MKRNALQTIGRPFNQLAKEEYIYYIDHYKEYADFNTLGLYRSLKENTRLSLEDAIKVRDYAHQTFQKTFDFLQVKDPDTYYCVSTMGMQLTAGDMRAFWQEIKIQQEKILNDKKIKHRNFGVYAKHSCCHPDCPYGAIMTQQGRNDNLEAMSFNSDKSNYGAKQKSQRNKTERKNSRKIIDRELDNT